MDANQDRIHAESFSARNTITADLQRAEEIAEDSRVLQRFLAELKEAE